MDDLISRQAAIDALWEIRQEEISDGRRFHDYCSLSTAVDVIKDLPAVQPQQTCEYWDSESKFCALCRPSVQPETCEGCKHLGKWENEVEYGYPSPCTRCKRRVGDHYER